MYPSRSERSCRPTRSIALAGVDEILSRIGSDVQSRFDAEKRVLDFESYLALALANPATHTRGAARYLRDAMDYFGTEVVKRPGGEATRWKIFDCRFDEGESEGRGHDHLVGQEAAQQEVHRLLSGFVREGRANRLLLLHGPNGSAKSTFVACLMRGLEAYSAREAGALYSFSWVFPRGTDGKGIGFGGTESPAPAGSYAHLPEERIDAKLVSPLREHPLMLIPRERRREVIRDMHAASDEALVVPDWLWDGDLGQQNRQIFDALLTAYRGDLSRVLCHIQVERFEISRRYRRGAVTIGPQMHVDATEQQITADRSLGSLPASLSALTLFETQGELVDAMGGIVEYSDLLKRPLDTWKYLLLAIESGEVALRRSNLALNQVMVASSNELHLNAFKEHPEYQSFRGRLHSLRLPYLLDYRDEQRIYDAQIAPQIERPLAPHTTFVVALWAVLTRLQRPKAERYSSPELGKLAAEMTPTEKAELYSSGDVPTRLSSEEARLLRTGVSEVMNETQNQAQYEGLIGASPREIRALLLDLAEQESEGCVAPPGLFRLLEAFCKRRDFDFLSLGVESGYHDALGFVEVVRECWLDRVEAELRISSGLVEEERHEALFARYVTQVSHWLKGERMFNPQTGDSERADEALMRRVESQLGVEEDEADFRRNIINTVAAHAIDNPDGEVDHSLIFPQQLARLQESYYRDRRVQIVRLGRAALTLLSNEGSAGDESLNEAAEVMLSSLYVNYGYEKSTARVAIAEWLRARDQA